jgi:hypothetical protein
MLNQNQSLCTDRMAFSRGADTSLDVGGDKVFAPKLTFFISLGSCIAVGGVDVD